MNLKPKAQEQAWQTLKNLAKALPQGLILVGPSGVGKRLAVKALFQWMNCQANGASDSEASLFGGSDTTASPNLSEPCGQCANCRKISENRHVDYIEIQPKGENIAVDDLREMKKTLFFPPTDSKVRFVVIDEAHKMNAFSANNILKTLEEPPAHTRFFLVTHERGLLLPTIISRCQFVHFSPLDDETIESLLAAMQIELPKNLRSTCLALSGGGLSRASLFANEKVVGFLETAQSMLLSAAAGKAMSWTEIVALADQLAAGAAGSELAGDTKIELFLDLLALHARNRALAAGHRGDQDAAYIAAELAMASAFLRRRLDRHANKKLVALAASSLLAYPLRQPSQEARR